MQVFDNARLVGEVHQVPAGFKAIHADGKTRGIFATPADAAAALARIEPSDADPDRDLEREVARFMSSRKA
jgi:hypothetical protein